MRGKIIHKKNMDLMNKKGIIVTLLLSCCLVAAQAQKAGEVHAFSIQQCIDYSHQHNV